VNVKIQESIDEIIPYLYWISIWLFTLTGLVEFQLKVFFTFSDFLLIIDFS